MRRIATLLFVAGIVWGQQDQWGQLMTAAYALEEAGRYEQARAAYQAILDRKEKTPTSSIHKAITLNNLALVNRYLGNDTEALEQYRHALELLKLACGDKSAEYASVLQNLGAYYQHKG